MSWLFSRALVEEFSQENSLDGELYAPLKATDMPQAFLLADKTKGIWSPFRFGMTYVRLTENLGEELLTWFLEGFPVKTSPSQEAEMELKDQSQAFGWRWQESSVKYDHNTSSWKTRQCSLLGGLESFSETWPRWGTMRGGECWALTTPKHPTSGIESGSWLATPTAKANQLAPCMVKNQGCRNWWPTPVAERTRYVNYKQGGRSLGAEVRRRQNWPTPAATDWKGSSKPGQRRGQLTDPAMGMIPAGGRLNPMWVEWLMGWPIGWTDLEPLETARFQRWFDSHGKR